MSREPTGGVRRFWLLAAAIALVTIGLGLAWFQPGSGDRAAWTAVCLRSGLLIAALWLALPEVLAIRPWRLAGLVLAVAVVAWRPRLFLAVAGLLVTLAFLRPRWQGQRRRG